MSTMPNLRSPNDVLKKLCRDSLRTYTSKNDEEVLDFFYSFCITSHSLRDWCIKSSSYDRNVFHEHCNTFAELAMCRDIANSNKHFGLDYGGASKVASIDPTKSIYKSPAESIEKPSLELHSADGERYSLWDFMNGTIESWMNVFDHFGIERDSHFTYTKSLEISVGDYVLRYF